ncbi:hypothetical protein R1sor_015828 [Riccia sorocarpa]|uniref:Protein-S-isoprenylcysteine O-methyltransferase n=1 Tax=Riccia sorocarpa TaxID=122646 RepID=A0ABD3HGE0_9MARC
MASALLASGHPSAFFGRGPVSPPTSSLRSRSKQNYARESCTQTSILVSCSKGVGELRGLGFSPLSFGKKFRLGERHSDVRLRGLFPAAEFGRSPGRIPAYYRDRGFPVDEENEKESKRVTLPLIGELPFDTPDLGKITAKKVAIWAVLAALVYATLNLIASRTVFNPKFWTYASWTLVVWPIPSAVLLALATLVTVYRARNRKPKEWEQVLMLVGSLVWLILVPLGHFHGFVDGWPLLLFTLYIVFFLISAVVRYKLYGNLASKSEDKQWEKRTSRAWQIGFVASVVAGHWLAAWEAPFLALSWNFGGKSQLAAAVLALAVFTHYNAAWFLGKYFDRLVKPRAVVMFGPYRWVRHPIYASYMLLFMGYCLALRSYKTMLFLLAACIAYYEQRTGIEEEQLVDTFGELYTDYVEHISSCQVLQSHHNPGSEILSGPSLTKVRTVA